jgi:hypothetical protein
LRSSPILTCTRSRPFHRSPRASATSAMASQPRLLEVLQLCPDNQPSEPPHHPRGAHHAVRADEPHARAAPRIQGRPTKRPAASAATARRLAGPLPFPPRRLHRQLGHRHDRVVQPRSSRPSSPRTGRTDGHPTRPYLPQPATPRVPPSASPPRQRPDLRRSGTRRWPRGPAYRRYLHERRRSTKCRLSAAPPRRIRHRGRRHRPLPRPRLSDSVRTLWDRARKHPFDFTRCCLCDRPW